MCGRFSLFADQTDVENRFGARFVGEYDPHYNAAPSQELPVIPDAAPEEIHTAEWGLIPAWADDRDDGGHINARAESATKKPSFRDAFAGRANGDEGNDGNPDDGGADDGDSDHGDVFVGDSGHGDVSVGDSGHGDVSVGDSDHGDVFVGDSDHGDVFVGDSDHGDVSVGDPDDGNGLESSSAGRCLVPADGFYEWGDAGDGRKPYRFEVGERDPFAMAGLWTRWEPPHRQAGLGEFAGEGGDTEPMYTFTILTTDANETVAPIHDRMPVILAPGEERAWVSNDVENVRSVLDPYDGRMRSYAVSSAVNDPHNNSPEVVEPVEEGAS